MAHVIPDALRHMNAQNTGARFSVHTGLVGEMQQALLDGELDCYIGRIDWDQMSPQMTSVLRFSPVFQTDLVLVCSTTHPLADQTNVRAKDLLEHSWALPTADSHNRIALESGMRNLGLAGSVPTVEVDADPGALIALAKQLNLLTCVPRLALDQQLAYGDILALDIPDLQLPPIQIGFVTLAEHEAMASLQTLRESVGAVTSTEFYT